VPADNKRRLEQTIAGIQAQWGIRAIRPGRQLPRVNPTPTHPHVSTGFPALDAALAIGGVPRGRITEIVGIPTSGLMTLALKIAANAQALDRTAIYLDLSKSFDPDYAARCGLLLDQLLLVRPASERQAMTMTHDFVLTGGMSCLLLHLPFELLREVAVAQRLSAALARVMAPLSKTDCALLCLVSLPPDKSSSLRHYPAGTNLPHYAAVRLLIRREGWLYTQHDINGYQGQVEIVKNKFAPAATGRRVGIKITFDEVVQGGGNYP
jgi:recombination protein RecA